MSGSEYHYLFSIDFCRKTKNLDCSLVPIKQGKKSEDVIIMQKYFFWVYIFIPSNMAPVLHMCSDGNINLQRY